jgi:N-acetylneuraminate synthase
MSVFLIAEIGINHNGDLNTAKQLIGEAVKAGFDAVKFQKRDVENVYSQSFLNASRESPWGRTQRDQKLGLEFDHSDYCVIDTFCREKGIEWFASPWDLNSAKFLAKFDLRYSKIASPMIVHHELLEAVAATGRHTFISTGMSDWKMVEDAVNIFRRVGCSFELMHCVSTYPMEPNHANLRAIPIMRERFDCNVGYSGHETGLDISIAAVALGITSLERHITLDRAMYGSDQSASIEPAGMARLVKSVKAVEMAMGNGEKYVLDEEKPVAEKLREVLA